MNSKEDELYIALKYNLRLEREGLMNYLRWKNIPDDFFILTGLGVRESGGLNNAEGLYATRPFQDKVSEDPQLMLNEMKQNLIAYDRIFNPEQR